MGQVVLLILITLVFGGSVVWIFGGRLRKTVRWWRKEQPAKGWKIATVVLVLVTLGWTIPMGIYDVKQTRSVPEEELLTITAPLDTLYEDSHTHMSRYNVHQTYSYSLSLQGYRGRLYFPKYLQLDQRDFLHWAGEEPLTYRYRKHTLYEVSRGDGSKYLTYREAADLLDRETVWDVGSWIIIVLVLTGGVMAIPADLSTGTPRERREKRRNLAIVGGLVIALLVLLDISRISHSGETKAHTKEPVTLGENIQVNLSSEWKEAEEEKEREFPWYQAVPKVHSRFFLEDCSYIPEGMDQETWEKVAMDHYRHYLLRSFIAETWKEETPFLKDWEVWVRRDGTELRFMQGWGESNHGKRAHLVVIPLFQQKEFVVLQSSASLEMDWDEMVAYVEKWVFPLLDDLVLPPSDSVPAPAPKAAPAPAA